MCQCAMDPFVIKEKSDDENAVIIDESGTVWMYEIFTQGEIHTIGVSIYYI